LFNVYRVITELLQNVTYINFIVTYNAMKYTNNTNTQYYITTKYLLTNHFSLITTQVERSNFGRRILNSYFDSYYSHTAVKDKIRFRLQNVDAVPFRNSVRQPLILFHRTINNMISCYLQYVECKS